MARKKYGIVNTENLSSFDKIINMWALFFGLLLHSRAALDLRSGPSRKCVVGRDSKRGIAINHLLVRESS